MAPAALPPTSPVSPAAPGSSASPERSVWRIPGFTRFWLARVALTGAYQMLSMAVQAIAAALLLAAAQGWGLQPGRALILGLSALARYDGLC